MDHVSLRVESGQNVPGRDPSSARLWSLLRGVVRFTGVSGYGYWPCSRLSGGSS